MKIAYVVYNERPTSGLMRTQVYSLLKEVSYQNPLITVELIAFWQPWVAWRYRREICILSAELEEAGIILRSVPLAVIPSRYFLYKTWLFPFLFFWVKLLFRIVLLMTTPDIIHCRGYFISLVAVQFSKKYGYRTIFDMRSLWPKEHLTIGAWHFSDPIYHLWQKNEAEIIKLADAIVGINQAMLNEIFTLYPEAAADLVFIPICVDTVEFKFNLIERLNRRANLGWSDKIVIVYQGSLGLMNSNLGEVVEYFMFIASLFSNARFLILTSNVSLDIPAILDGYGLSRDIYTVRNPSAEELPAWLSAADAGIHAMSLGPDSTTRLGVKVVEYLSCSLPIIVNSAVGAAAELVYQYSIGVVIDLTDEITSHRQLENLFNYCVVPSKKSRMVARETFSVESCAASYFQLYKKLVSI